MSSSAPGVPAQATNPHRTVRRAVGRHGRILAAPAGVDGPGRDGHDLPSGVAPAGSVLAGSLLTEYPAAAGGDCSAVPDRPAGTEGHDVAVVDPDVLSTLDRRSPTSTSRWRPATTPWPSPPDLPPRAAAHDAHP